jgi:hypothetical protein
LIEEHNVSGGAEEDLERLQFVQPFFGPRFQLGTSQNKTQKY